MGATKKISMPAVAGSVSSTGPSWSPRTFAAGAGSLPAALKRARRGSASRDAPGSGRGLDLLPLRDHLVDGDEVGGFDGRVRVERRLREELVQVVVVVERARLLVEVLDRTRDGHAAEDLLDRRGGIDLGRDRIVDVAVRRIGVVARDRDRPGVAVGVPTLLGQHEAHVLVARAGSESHLRSPAGPPDDGISVGDPLRAVAVARRHALRLLDELL